MSRQLYQENIIEHYRNPSHTTSIELPTHEAEMVNYSCGDEIKIKLRINNGIIEDIEHDTVGCAIAVASTSILSEHLINKPLKEVEGLDIDSMQEIIGIDISPSRSKCLLLGLEAIRKSLRENK